MTGNAQKIKVELLDPMVENDLANYLIKTGKLKQNEAEKTFQLISEQKNNTPFGLLLVRMGILSDRDLAEAEAEFRGIPLTEESNFPDIMPCEDRISIEFLKRNLSIIIEENDDNVVVAMADPGNRYLLDSLEMASKKRVVSQVAIISEIESAYRQNYNEKSDEEGASDIHPLTDSFSDDDVEHLRELASDAPIIKRVNQLIHQAVNQNVSDIHIEPFEDNLKIRYRIDGILRDVENAPSEIASAVVSRTKILANLNIAERRLPQDGRFKIKVRGAWLDLRVSTVPTVYGESVVMRLLRGCDTAGDFDGLGFTSKQKKQIHSILDNPHGIILVTGPTGSGKTTTLYAALNHMNTPERKIITVEDPVEYNMSGINQIQVKPQIDLTFSNILRTIVRQDPDIIMIGEMRDFETASIAVQSALTGHLVLSTLHTNDAAGSITRLLDMGIDSFLLKSTINAVVAQRLVRKLCGECKSSYPLNDKIAQQLCAIEITGRDNATFYKAIGCDKCHGTGYIGRVAIVEIIILDDAIRDMIMDRADSTSIARYAKTNGFGTLYEDGLSKAAQGITSVEEVLRVTRFN